MAATSIGSTGNYPYTLAKMPELTDAADIQVALRNYHYGQNGALTAGTNPTAGIAFYLKEIEDDIAALVTADGTVVSKTIVDAKGDLIVGSAADTVVKLTAGSAGYILSTDTAETSGLKWIAPVQLSDSTSTTSSTVAASSTAVKAAYDKASTAATTSVVGVVQLSDSTSETSSIKAATPTAVSTLKQTVDSSTKTANYTLDPTDAGKIIIMNVSSSTSIITIPLETTFPAGARVDILQIGSVQTSIAPVSGSVTLNSKNNNRKLSGQYSAATLIKTGTNTMRDIITKLDKLNVEKPQLNEGLADMAHEAEKDHEVQMARADLYKLAKYAIKLHEMLKHVSEAEGMEGWQQSKITKAADYISSVYHSIDYDQSSMSESKKTPLVTMSESNISAYKTKLSKKLKKLQ